MLKSSLLIEKINRDSHLNLNKINYILERKPNKGREDKTPKKLNEMNKKKSNKRKRKTLILKERIHFE